MKIHISYVYHNSPRSNYNFAYFLENELKYRENVYYTIVINGRLCNFNIPQLDNCRVIYRDNTGFDFGGHAAGLDALGKNIDLYDYFFFLNCGVIGPILKNKNESWYDKFTNKFNKKVKLVGTSIVCLPKEDLGGFGPKVEGFCFCLDKEGLDLTLKDGTIFYNHKNKTDAILNGEYALTKCILAAGYTIDCMLKEYQNVNWNDSSNYFLNNNKHPSRQNSFFGKSINPYDVIFHKWLWGHEPTKPVSKEIIENNTKKRLPLPYTMAQRRAILFQQQFSAYAMRQLLARRQFLR